MRVYLLVVDFGCNIMLASLYDYQSICSFFIVLSSSSPPFCPMYPPVSFLSSQLRKDHPKRLHPDWHKKRKSYCWYCSFISCFPLYSVHKQYGCLLRELPSTKFLHSENPATSPTQTSLPLWVVLVTWTPWIPVVTVEILHYWNKILNLF